MIRGVPMLKKRENKNPFLNGYFDPLQSAMKTWVYSLEPLCLEGSG